MTLIYVLRQPIRAFRTHENESFINRDFWYQRLAHLNHIDLQRLTKLAIGIDLSETTLINKDFYEPCVLDK